MPRMPLLPTRGGGLPYADRAPDRVRVWVIDELGRVGALLRALLRADDIDCDALTVIEAAEALDHSGICRPEIVAAETELAPRTIASPPAAERPAAILFDGVAQCARVRDLAQRLAVVAPAVPRIGLIDRATGAARPHQGLLDVDHNRAMSACLAAGLTALIGFPPTSADLGNALADAIRPAAAGLHSLRLRDRRGGLRVALRMPVTVVHRGAVIRCDVIDVSTSAVAVEPTACSARPPAPGDALRLRFAGDGHDSAPIRAVARGTRRDPDSGRPVWVCEVDADCDAQLTGVIAAGLSGRRCA
jgi:hypothetical protein